MYSFSSEETDMDDLLGKMAGGILGGGGGQPGMAAVLFQLLQNQPGGLAGLLKGFQSKGLVLLSQKAAVWLVREVVF